MIGTRIPAADMADAALKGLSEPQRIAYAISLVRDIAEPSSAQHLLRLGRSATDHGNQLAKRQFERRAS